MAKKPTISNITNSYSSAGLINDNFDKINNALDNTLSRDGTGPNNMNADLDMDGHDILNAGRIHINSIDFGNFILPTVIDDIIRLISEFLVIGDKIKDDADRAEAAVSKLLVRRVEGTIGTFDTNHPSMAGIRVRGKFLDKNFVQLFLGGVPQPTSSFDVVQENQYTLIKPAGQNQFDASFIGYSFIIIAGYISSGSVIEAIRAENAADRSEAAAAFYGPTFASRAVVQALTGAADLDTIAVKHQGKILRYVREVGPVSDPALVTADGIAFAPQEQSVDLASFGVIYNDLTVDNRAAVQRAINWCMPKSRKLVHMGGNIACSGPLFFRNSSVVAQYASWSFTGIDKETCRWTIINSHEQSKVFMTSRWTNDSAQTSAIENKRFGNWTYDMHPDRVNDLVHPIPFSLGVNGNCTVQDMRFMSINNTRMDFDCSYNLRRINNVAWHGGIAFSSGSGPAPTLTLTANSTTVVASAPCFKAGHKGVVIFVDDAKNGPSKFMRAEIVEVVNATTVVLSRSPDRNVTAAMFGVGAYIQHNESFTKRVEQGLQPPDVTNDLFLLDNWVELGAGICTIINAATKVRVWGEKLHGNFQYGDRPTQSCLWASNVEGYYGPALIESFTTGVPIYVTSQNTETLTIDSPQFIVMEGRPIIEVGKFQGTVAGARGKVEVIGTVRCTNSNDHNLFYDPNTELQRMLYWEDATVTAPNKRFSGRHKIAVAFGDSLTQDADSFIRMYASDMGYDMRNYAIGGARMAGGTGSTFNAQLSLAESNGDVQRADVIFVQFGTNDANQGGGLGNLGGNNIESFYGAMEVLYAKILSLNPNVQVIFTQPPMVVNSIHEFNNRIRREAIRNFCDNKNLPTWDLSIGMNAQNIGTLTHDGVHFTKAGNKFIKRQLTTPYRQPADREAFNRSFALKLRGATGPVEVDQGRPSTYIREKNKVTWWPNFWTFNKTGMTETDDIRIPLPEGRVGATTGDIAMLSGANNSMPPNGLQTVQVRCIFQQDYAVLFSPALNRNVRYSDLTATTVYTVGSITYIVE